jgi:predicted transcriptional regulator
MGKGKPIIPMLSKGLTHRGVPQPLSQLHIIECYEAASVFQFLEDSAKVLDLQISKPSFLHRAIEKVLEFTDAEASPRKSMKQHPKAELLNLDTKDTERRNKILSSFSDFSDDRFVPIGEICKSTGLVSNAAIFYLDEMIGEGLIEESRNYKGEKFYKITHEGRHFWLKGPIKNIS